MLCNYSSIPEKNPAWKRFYHYRKYQYYKVRGKSILFDQQFSTNRNESNPFSIPWIKLILASRSAYWMQIEFFIVIKLGKSLQRHLVQFRPVVYYCNIKVAQKSCPFVMLLPIWPLYHFIRSLSGIFDLILYFLQISIRLSLPDFSSDSYFDTISCSDDSFIPYSFAICSYVLLRSCTLTPLPVAAYMLIS